MTLPTALTNLIGRKQVENPEPTVIRVPVIDYAHEQRRLERKRDRRNLAEWSRYARLIAVGYFVTLGVIGTVSSIPNMPQGAGVSLGVLLALVLGLWVTLNKDFVRLAERFRGAS